MLLRLFKDQKIRWVGTWKFYLWLAALMIWSIHSVIGGIFGSTLLVLSLFVVQFTRNSKTLLVVFISCTMIAAPLLQDTKSAYRQRIKDENITNEQELGELAFNNFRKVFLQGDLMAYKEGITALSYRLCTFEIWSRVKSHMDTIQDFANGRTIIDALTTSFIPRIIWPDKPLTGGISDLAKLYADMPVYDGTSVSVGVISEFYINGGMAFLIPGMLALGYVGGYLLNRGTYDRIQPLGLMMSLSMFAVFVRPETSLSDMLGAMIRLLFLWLVLRYWILSSHKKNLRFMAKR